MAKKKKKMPGLNTSSTADISFMLLIFFLWIEDEMSRGYGELSELRGRVKEFVKNEQNLSKLPEKHVKNIDLLGQCFVTDKHVISVQTDRGTPYNMYFQVQNELVAAYNELRNELSKQKFGREMQYLKEDELKAIKQYYPQNISEAEPKKYGGD